MSTGIPTLLQEDEAYYWMDDHVVVASAYLDYTEAIPYHLKQSFAPYELMDPSEETAFGFWYLTENSAEFIRLMPKDVDPKFLTALLLLGVNTNGN